MIGDTKHGAYQELILEAPLVAVAQVPPRVV